MNLKKMKLKTLLLFFVVALSLQVIAQSPQSVILTGKAPDYRDYEIQLYRYADAISKTKEFVSSISIDAEGNFHSTAKLSTTTYCFADFDAYRAFIYLEPGKEYELVFPPLKQIPASQKRNPFFQAEETAFALKNSSSDDLNRQIQQFELAYLKEESRYFNQIFNLQSKAAVDSLKANLSRQFSQSNNTYFNQYLFYRTAFAEYALHQGQSESFVQNYFIDHQPDLLIPSCRRLFRQLFNDYFTFESNQIRGTEFKQLVARANLNGIEDYFANKKQWNTNLSQLVILQSIHDAYSQGQFSQGSLLRLLNTIEASNWPSDKKKIAKRLKERLTYLQTGSDAPTIKLTDFSGVSQQLSSFKGKYIYLNFTRVANPICRQHLDQLKQAGDVLKQQVHILNLILPEEASKQELILQQHWPGEFFIINEQAADTYRVTTLPMAYLVDPSGKLVMSPAPNPLDGFEQQFLNLLKQNRLNELRQQGR